MSVIVVAAILSIILQHSAIQSFQWSLRRTDLTEMTTVTANKTHYFVLNTL